MSRAAHSIRQADNWGRKGLVLLAGLAILAGCATQPASPPKTIYSSGFNTVRIEADPDSSANTHPATLTPTEIGTLLRNVRVWERRNAIHRLFSGEANRTRAFRDEEIVLLAPQLSKGLVQAAPAERVHFRLSHATEHGEEETTAGWLAIRGSILVLTLTEVHDRHSPGPDISKYDRQMPNVPEQSPLFDATFEPEEYLAKMVSGGRLFSPDQREELYIRYREALAVLPIYPGLEPRPQRPAPQP